MRERAGHPGRCSVEPKAFGWVRIGNGFAGKSPMVVVRTTARIEGYALPYFTGFVEFAVRALVLAGDQSDFTCWIRSFSHISDSSNAIAIASSSSPQFIRGVDWCSLRRWLALVSRIAKMSQVIRSM